MSVPVGTTFGAYAIHPFHEVVVGEALAVGCAAAPLTAPTNEAVGAKDVTDGAHHCPGASGLLAREHHEQRARAPPVGDGTRRECARPPPMLRSVTHVRGPHPLFA